MGKTLKILSIDYDYFVDANKDQVLMHFPDPIDLTPNLSAQVWDMHYMHHGDIIRSINLRSVEYTRMITKLSYSITADLCMFSYTHKDIIRCIEDIRKSGNYNKLIVNHIDTHPDTGNITYNEVHCGNWVTHLKQMYEEVDIRWIANEALYEIQDVNEKLLPKIKFGIDKLSNIKHYDLIFLCRSDQWVPPHLDQQFTDMVHKVRATRSMGVIASLVPRNINY